MEKHLPFMVVVAYQNTGRGADNTNVFLEWYGENEVDICFVGEVWWNSEGKTQFRIGYS